MFCNSLWVCALHLQTKKQLEAQQREILHQKALELLRKKKLGQSPSSSSDKHKVGVLSSTSPTTSSSHHNRHHKHHKRERGSSNESRKKHRHHKSKKRRKEALVMEGAVDDTDSTNPSTSIVANISSPSHSTELDLSEVIASLIIY